MSGVRIQSRLPEKLALVGIVVLTLILLLASIRFEREVNRQKSLFYELQILRTSIQLFKAIEQDNPEALPELANGSYKFPNELEQRHFLEYTPNYDDKGQMCDPFGTPYVYNVKTAWVRSNTPGYEFW